VAQSAAAAGAHYIDLADGCRFVCDVPPAMNATFRESGYLAASGANAVPALSSVVTDHLCAGRRQIDCIECCVAPAQAAPCALATIAAVLSYCGEPIQVWQDGQWQVQIGWVKSA
jgi:saccharopine dehydrogenase-like NADP-dependent oxidoreductase